MEYVESETLTLFAQSEGRTRRQAERRKKSYRALLLRRNLFQILWSTTFSLDQSYTRARTSSVTRDGDTPCGIPCLASHAAFNYRVRARRTNVARNAGNLLLYGGYPGDNSRRVFLIRHFFSFLFRTMQSVSDTMRARRNCELGAVTRRARFVRGEESWMRNLNYARCVFRRAVKYIQPIARAHSGKSSRRKRSPSAIIRRLFRIINYSGYAQAGRITGSGHEAENNSVIHIAIDPWNAFSRNYQRPVNEQHDARDAAASKIRPKSGYIGHTQLLLIKLSVCSRPPCRCGHWTHDLTAFSLSLPLFLANVFNISRDYN